MNIIVKSTGGRYYCRPDTTWEREDKDLFSPDSVNGYLYTPVLFARICKAGKCIGVKFAERYYDSVSYGILLYDRGLFDGSEMAYASASCLDHTSVLPFPMSDRHVLQEEGSMFILRKDGEEIYRTDEGSTGTVEKAISEASAGVSLRIGDIVAIELASPSLLASRPENRNGNTGNEIRGTFHGNDLFNFRIIF